MISDKTLEALPAREIGAGRADTSPTALRTWEKNGYTLTSLARYRIDALVISTEPSWFDGGADLSPVDFAVAWGPMSDPGRLSVTSPICT